MRSNSYQAMILAVTMSLMAAAQTTKEVGCGTLNGSTCTPFDNEFWNIRFTDPVPCDFGLQPSGSTCVNTTRQTYKSNSDWASWALPEQIGNIQANVALNHINFFGTHNSFSTYAEGFQSTMSTDQALSLTDQLQLGARYVRLDPGWYDSNMRLCHGSTTLCAVFAPPQGDLATAAAFAIDPPLALLGADTVLSPGRLFAFAVKELGDWMTANPNEFLVLDMNATPDGHEDYISQPLLDSIGRDKILTPADIQGMTGFSGFSTSVASMQFPTLSAVKALGKRIIIFSSNPIGSLTFDRGTFHTETMSKYWYSNVSNQTRANYCLDDSGNPLIPTSLPGKWPYASEDRSLSPMFDTNYGYLDDSQVTAAVQCGYSTIAVDFLMNKGLTQYFTATGDGYAPAPDYGTDTRREAAVWSWLQGDYGANGPATMTVSNGRWQSQPIQTSYPYACAKTDPTTTAEPAWFISSAKGNWNGGSAACTGGLFAYPVTAQQNLDLKKAAAAAGVMTLWLNYHTPTADLLSIGTSSLYFDQAGTNLPAAQDVQVYGVSNATLTFQTTAKSSDYLLVNGAKSGQVTLDPQGKGTIAVSIDPAVSVVQGFHSAVILLMESTGISLGAIPTTLVKAGTDTITLSGIPCNGNQCTVDENTPMIFTTTVSRSQNANIPVVGAADVRELSTDFSTGQGIVTTQAQSQALTFTPSKFASQSSTTFKVTLPPGTHNIESYYSGDQADSPGFSNQLTVTVKPYLQLSLSSVSLSTVYGHAVVPIQLQISNPQRISINAQSSCYNQTPCSWLMPQRGTYSNGYNQVPFDLSATSSLAPGSYKATITISGTGVASQTADIQVIVTGILTTSTQSMTLNVTNKVLHQAIAVQVSNNNTQVNAASSAAWLSYDSLGIRVNAIGLAPGTHDGSIVFSSPYAANSVTVDVKVFVSSSR